MYFLSFCPYFVFYFFALHKYDFYARVGILKTAVPDCNTDTRTRGNFLLLVFRPMLVCPRCPPLAPDQFVHLSSSEALNSPCPAAVLCKSLTRR